MSPIIARLVLQPLLLINLCLCFSQCQQTQDIKAFTEADYRLLGVEQARLNNIDLQERAESGQRLSAEERDALLAAVSANNLPLEATLLLQVSLREATGEQRLTVTQMKWLVLVDGEEAFTGTVHETMVLHDGENQIPVKTQVQLSEVNGLPNYEGLSRVINLISSGGDIRQAITFQIKPTIKTPLGNIESPQFISVSKPSAPPNP